MAANGHWRLILLSDFQCPEPPASTRLQRSWHKLQRVFGITDESDTNNGSTLPDYAGFNRTPAVKALDHGLKGWPGQTREVRFLLDPPFSATADIARDWAEWRQWPCLQPPTITQLVSADVEAWWQSQQVRGPWLIDDISRYFLRTATGMRFLRCLLMQLVQGAFGTGLVVCNSWTYRFITQGFDPGLSAVYCFAPATPGLLRELGIKGAERQLTRLAARARGNAGVALALWKAELEQPPLPHIPASMHDNEGFVLYALLLHGGLNEAALQQVLPMLAPEQLAASLLRMLAAGLVAREQTRWHISPVAYGEVREFLAGRDHCLDEF
ncbi:hypothetical protein N2M06_06605 [Oceanimonas sp. AH20CE76]|uniref:hypothetical protein n=1 Tax=Oceanimonas TaxID=129577 RepID=UPI0031FF0F26